MGGNEETAMDVVGAALRGNLNLRATEAAVLGVIGIRKNLYTFNGVLGRRYDRCAAPDGASGADAINRNAVVFGLLPTGDDLRSVFGLEDAVRPT